MTAALLIRYALVSYRYRMPYNWHGASSLYIRYGRAFTTNIFATKQLIAPSNVVIVNGFQFYINNICD
jgi:hypothetical protein